MSCSDDNTRRKPTRKSLGVVYPCFLQDEKSTGHSNIEIYPHWEIKQAVVETCTHEKKD